MSGSMIAHAAAESIAYDVSPYRDTLGFEVRNDVAYGGMRWITVGPADEPGTSISGLPARL